MVKTIIHITTELAPIAKAGGLADVLYGLSKELLRLDQKVTVILPKYRCLEGKNLRHVKLALKKSFTFADNKPFDVLFWRASYEDISLILIDPQQPETPFNRSSIYGEPDDIDRFLLFSVLALEYLCLEPALQRVLHLHDWPTAFISYLHKHVYYKRLPACKTLLTIHNILHQGRCLPSHVDRFGISPSSELIDPAEPRLINLLKAGLMSVDHIVTVSPTYAREITTHAFGYHLHPILASRPEKLFGILNGIDLNYWDPSQDRMLHARYGAKEAIETIAKAKRANKAHLQKTLQLSSSQAPLFGCISRLDMQKGPHLIARAITTILDKGGQFVLLGQIADPKFKEEFDFLRKNYNNNANFHFHDQFNESLARQLYAASDFIVIPSLFEPCGLTQMIAMRYFTIPIVRSTGGLADTVYDIEDSTISSEKKVGICFRDMQVEQMDEALHRAFHLYHETAYLHKILNNLKNSDFSWKKPAQQYLQLYQAS